MKASAALADKGSRTERRWTYAALCAELEETHQPCELSQGQLTMSPSPTPFHQLVAQRLEDSLRRWVEKRRLGVVFDAPLDVVLNPETVFQPDLLFISKPRLRIVKQYIDGAPDLIVEVVSPDRPRRDYKEKKEQYEAHGVREYWIVDPDRRRLEVWTLQNGFYELAGAYAGTQYAASVLLPGFKVRVNRLFIEGW